MIVLGIECTGPFSSVALLEDDRVLEQRSLTETAFPPTQPLLTTVQELCRAHQLTPREVNLLAVTRGPGSFTGLRVGLTFAKTFAYATGCSLKSLTNFEATVCSLPGVLGTIEVIEDLRQQQVAWQRFQFTESRWEPITEIMAEPLDVWAGRERKAVCHTGLGPARLARQLPEGVWPEEWKLLPEEQRAPDAIAVASWGRILFLEHGGEDPFQLIPLYVRKSAAEEKRDRQQQKK